MLVLLDRDGVINEDTPNGITQIDQLKLIDGAGEAIAKLNMAQVKVAVVTNQSVIGKELVTETELETIHDHLRTLLAKYNAHVDAIYWCGDHPERATQRRKPSAGMLQEALAEFGAIPAQTPMVGDALRDMQAAHAAGCQAHLVRTGKGVQTELESELCKELSVQIHDDLPAFAEYWLHQSAKLA